MDKKDEALKLALEYLRDNQHYIADNERHAYVMEYNAFVERLETLAEHIVDANKMVEQPAQQTIHCKHRRENNGVCPHHNLQCGWPKCNEPEQPAQPSKPWVGLTEQERNDLEDYCEMIIGKAAFDAIEAKLKEKNA